MKGYSFNLQQNWKIPLNECCPLLTNETRTFRTGEGSSASKGASKRRSHSSVLIFVFIQEVMKHFTQTDPKSYKNDNGYLLTYQMSFFFFFPSYTCSNIPPLYRRKVRLMERMDHGSSPKRSLQKPRLATMNSCRAII